MPAKTVGLSAFVLALCGAAVIVGCNLNLPAADAPPSDIRPGGSDQPPPSDEGVEFPAPEAPGEDATPDDDTPEVVVDPLEEFASEDLLGFVVGVDADGETIDSVDLRALSVGTRIVLSIPNNAPAPTRQIGPPTADCQCSWSVVALDGNDAEPIGIFDPPDACTTTYTVLRVGDALITATQTCGDSPTVRFSQGISTVSEPADTNEPDSDEEEDDELVTVTPGGGGGGGADVTPPPTEMVALTVAIEGDGGVAVTPAASAEAGANGVTRQYEVGTPVTLLAVNSDSGCFFRWGGDVHSTNGELIVTLAADTFVLAEFVDRTAPSRAPSLDAHVAQTTDATIPLSGSVQTCQNDPADTVEIVGPGGTVEAAVVDGAFAIDVPLSENRTNQLFVTPISVAGVRGAPATTVVTHDAQPPSLFIDFPVDGAELTTDEVDVGGRVSDMLSGFLGLTVTVDGVEAVVDVGIGTNGTFVRPGVPLSELGSKTITVIATDVLGNSFQRSVTVTRIEIPAGVPKLEVVSGNAQTAQIGGLLPEPITVRVTNGDGTPFANKVVTFDVTRSNGRLIGDGDAGPSAAAEDDGTMMLQVRTDADGLAEAMWRMGFDAGCGNNRVEVTSTSIVGTTLFCASATPAPPAQINIGTGNNQRAETGGPAPEPLRVWVNDQCNGVPGVPVTFTVIRGDGRVDDRTSVTVETSDTGHAEVTFTLGTEPGNNIVEANFATNPTEPAQFIVFGVARDETQPTSFSGIVLDNANQPIEGADCTLSVGGQDFSSASDFNGVFRFDDLTASGPAGLHVDGTVALGSFPSLHFELVIIPNVDNSLPTPVLLPALNPVNAREFDNTQDVELTVEGLEGLTMIVRAGSMTLADGTVPSKANPTVIALNQVHFDKIPMPIPDGAAPPFAWTLQPAGAHFDPPVEIIYPNMSGLPAGSIAYFLSFNHATMRFEIISTGSVTDDGASIVTDPGGGITTAGWGCNCPPYSATGDCEDCESGSMSPSIAPSAAGTDQCDGCTVSIVGDTCVRANEEITFTATPLPEGGIYEWSGGVPVGDTDGPIYVTKFLTAQSTTVTLNYTCPDDLTADAQVNLEVFGDKFVVTGGLTGDVITVDLSCLGLENLTLSARTNELGFVARRINSDEDNNYIQVLKDTGRFYFVPKRTGGTGTSELTVTGTDPDGNPSGDIEITVEFFNVSEGYSNTGPDRVVPGTTQLLVHRVQQRLNHFGFPDRNGNPVPVNGILATGNSRTRWAIGLFNAAVTNSNHSAQSTINGPFINAFNAPRWKLVDPGNYFFNTTANGTKIMSVDKYGTSWLEEILVAAGAAHTPGAAYPITDLCRRIGGPSPPHDTHQAGMDADINVSTVQKNLAPVFFQQHSNGVVKASRTDTDGNPLTPGDLIRQGTATFSVVAHGAAVPAGRVRQTVGNLVRNADRLEAAYDSGLLVLITAYADIRTELTSQFTAFFGAAPASGARVSKILFNDPFFYGGDSGIAGSSFGYHSGHNGHYHVDIAPPTVQAASPTSPSRAPSREQNNEDTSPATANGIDRLDETWTLFVGGQTVQVNPDGSFRVPNIAAPDLFGPGGPGTRPDFISDDFIRAFAVSTAGGITRYAFSEPFQIVTGETFRVGRFTFVDEPPLFLANSLLIEADETLLFVGESILLQVTGLFPGGTERDATARSTGTVYRTSNPVVASVSEDGVVTAVGSGRVFVTVVNGGTTGTKEFNILQVAVRSTVEGYVYLTDGSPVEGAAVAINLGGETTTDSDGFFALTFEAPENLSVTATASTVIEETPVEGVSETVPIVANGITDVGIITLSVEFEGPLFAIPTYRVGRSPNAIASGDFDGDGDIDLVTANGSSNDVTVLLNNGDGSFSRAASVPVGGPGGVAVADLNGDDKLDLAATSDATDVISIMFGRGDGTFEDRITIDAGDSPRDIAIGDLDGDGSMDLAVVNFNSDDVLVLLNDGNGVFATGVSYPTLKRPLSIVLADFDGDGSLDIGTTSLGRTFSPTGSGGTSIFLNNFEDTLGTFAPRMDLDSGFDRATLDAGDMDGDGDIDLVVNKSGVLVVYLNDGNAVFTEDAGYPIAAAHGGLKLRDLDGDGDLDVALVLLNSAKTAIFLNQGGGTLGSPTAYATGSTSNSVVMEDLDGDSDIDVAVASTRSDSVSIMFNHGAGAFPEDNFHGVPLGSGRFVTTGDLDNDGDPDLALTSFGKLTLLFNGGHGTFVGNPFIDIQCATRVTAGHLNNDDFLDLAVGDPCNGLLWILLGLGDGTFAPPVSYRGARDGATFADTDGDGNLDAVARRANGNGVAILPGNGDGTFGLAQNLPVPHSVRAVLVGNLNVEGAPDLLVIGFGTNSIFFGIGDGTFSDPVQFNTQNLVSATLVDVDGDGAPDLVGTRLSNGTPVAVVLLNLGNGLFGEEIVYGDDGIAQAAETSVAGGGPTLTIATGDMTGDGRPDLLVTYKSLTVFVNQGEGIFDNGASYVVAGSEPTDLVIVDLDADSDLDAVVLFGSGLGIMLNRRVRADCDGNGVLDDLDVFNGTSSDCNANGTPDVCDADCDASGTPDDCDVADGLVDDCNNNGLPDLCERDCDGNGRPDDCDIADGTAFDCNANGNLDVCDFADGVSGDCNSNGVPDECDTDCNSNGVPDDCDIDDGTSQDCQPNGIPDECDIVTSELLFGSTGEDDSRIYTMDPITGQTTLFADLNAQLEPDFDLPPAAGLAVSPDGRTLFVSPGGEVGDALLLSVDLRTGQGSVVGNTGRTISDLAFLPDGTMIGSAPSDRELVMVDTETGQTQDLCSTGTIKLSGLAISPQGVVYGTTGGRTPSGTLFRVNLDTCELTQIGNGTTFSRVPGLAFTPDGRLIGSTQDELIEIDINTGIGTLIAPITGASGIDGLAFGKAADCNDNAIPDDCDIDSGLLADDDMNGIPDECE